MVRKIQAKLVLRLHGQGLSGRAIARSQGMSRRSVADVLDAAKAAGIGWDDVANRPDDEVYALLFPGRGERESVYEQPDWGKVHRELARVGVTLRILHGEYVDECRQSGRPHMGYDRFCKLYAAYVARLGVTSRVEHKAGRTIEVDWAGKTMRIVDPVTGDSSTVYLFVAVLPFSRYAFVEPTLDMGQNSWLRAHVAMYEWFGGSTPRLVCDNLKTGVIKHPREGEIVLNDAYRGMAEHYSAAVLPGRVRKPKDKPSAENTVWHVTMALVGAMRDHEFGSLDELRAAIRAWLAEYNSRAFQKRDGSRSSVFESEEKPLLITLPLMPYEVADWVYGRRVQANSHVAYARNWYSVPYAYIGSTVDLRIGASMLEVWHGEHAVVLAPAPAGDGIQPVVHERVRPARQSRVETMGQETLRAMGPANRPRLRRRDRQAVRHGTPRRASCGCRNAIPPNVWRTRVRCRCGRSLRRGIRTSDRSSNPARTPRAGSPTAPLTTSDGCAAAITTRTWEGGRAMIIDTETKRKLREMNASDLLDAFERLDERTTAPMSHTEVVRLAVDNAHSGHMDAKIQRLVKRAGLRYPPQADLRTIDLGEERRLDRSVIAGLDAGNYLEQRLNVVFQGATGSGKSHLLCALVKSACRARYRAVYVRMPDLAEQVTVASNKSGGVPKLVRKYATYNLLAIDEWLVDKPDELFKRFLLELMELRYDTVSTAFATQLATKEWHRQLGGDTIADTILDRIVHNAIWINTGEYNMRQRHGQAMLDN